MTADARKHDQPTLWGEDRPCFIVAEIGVNFNGDLDLARKTIDAAAASGADAVKFQTFRAEEFLADPGLTHSYQDRTGRWITETQFDMFKRLELKKDWHRILHDHSRDQGLVFLSSSADRQAVDWLDELDVPAFKLASEDLINHPLLEYVARKNRPVILSTGMADEAEIRMALEILSDCPEILLLHCTSVYPAPAAECNLARMQSLGRTFGRPAGFSDHTLGWEAAMLSAGLGARLIEKHFTLDRGLPGPDHALSADPDLFKVMVEKIRLAELLLGQGDLVPSPSEAQSRISFRRSLVARVGLEKGEKVTREKLACKRPGGGLKPYQIDLVLGRTLKRDLEPNEKITLEDLTGDEKDE